MALKTTMCVVVHHACQTRAYFPTMDSSFKLSSGTVCLTRFAASISVTMHLIIAHKW